MIIFSLHIDKTTGLRDARLRDIGLSRSPEVPCPEVKSYCSLILNPYLTFKA